jgi:hypothetical protein
MPLCSLLVSCLHNPRESTLRVGPGGDARTFTFPRISIKLLLDKKSLSGRTNAKHYGSIKMEHKQFPHTCRRVSVVTDSTSRKKEATRNDLEWQFECIIGMTEYLLNRQ